jgi:RimJ/RimL family protein N-acetyltransferase
MVIRPFRVDDVHELSAYARQYPSEQPGSWLGGSLPSDAARYIADTIARYGRPPRADLALSLDGQLIGGLGFRQVWVAPFQLDIGWVVHPAAVGHGLATEAVYALLDHLDDAFPELVRVEARVRASDTAGIRLLEGLGFQKEGQLRRAAGDGGDASLYGLLRGERMHHVGAS